MCSLRIDRMTAEGTTPTTTTTTGMPSWAKKSILIAVGVLALVIAYFILAAFLPRWWSIRVGNLSDQAFSKGILWGLTFGTLCTLVPLLLFTVAWAVRKRRGGKVVAIIALVLAVATAIPNLLTLSIVLGGNNASHAGERTLDTEAPGFRGASLVGAVIAIVLFALLTFVVVQGQRRRAQKRLNAATTNPAASETGQGTTGALPPS